MARKHKSLLSRLGKALGELLLTYNRRNGPLLAKGLGFSFLFGLIPLLFLAVSVAGYLYRVKPGIEVFINQRFLDFIPFTAREILLSHVTRIAGNWGALGIIGILFLFAISLALFDSIERALATMLSAPRRKFHFGRLISLGLMAGAVLFFFSAAAISTATTYFSKSIGMHPTFVYWGGRLLSAVILAGILMGLYYLFARRRLRFWPTLGIAFLTALVWQVIMLLGSIVIRYAGRRVLVYGALAWVTIFLIYMRLLAEILLVSSLLVSRASPPEKA